MWKIAGHTMGTPEQSVPEAIVLFKQAGLQAAEVIWQDGYRSGIPEDDGGETVRAVKKASKEQQLPVLGLTPYMSGINSLDRDERVRDIARFRRCVADAHELGATVVRVYAGSYMPHEQKVRAAKWNHLVESLRTLAPVAEDAGVTLVVENHFSTMTVSAAETAELMRAVNHPSVGILYDQANLTFTHCEEFGEAIRLQAPWIRHVHVKDLVFTDPSRPFSASAVATVPDEERAVRSRVVGDGIVDWAGILEQLRLVGYRGDLSLEYEYRWHREDLPEPPEGFRRGGEALYSLVETVR